jgi:dipeptidyl aminopeptidase/acylaminoacyl peptidase
MRRPSWFLCGAMLCGVAAAAHARVPAEQRARDVVCADQDGCLLSSEPLAVTKPYAQLDDLSKLRFPEAEYEEARNQRDFECLKITYRSGGLRIVGFIYKPKQTSGRKLPTIIFNRGGTADFGAVAPEELVTFYFWAKAGFVVLASNYRGGGGSEGVDEWGGRDVDDVLNLIPLARDLGYVDMANLFMIGLSRGGPMTYMAIRRKFPVNAAAVIAGPTDLRIEAKTRRAEFVEADDPALRRMGWPGWRRVWPDFERREAEHLSNRSVVDWVGEIDVPLLLLHSRTDSRVPVEHTLKLAALLQQQKKEYEVVLYANDGHSLPRHRQDRDAHIINWFKTHMRTAP